MDLRPSACTLSTLEALVEPKKFPNLSISVFGLPKTVIEALCKHILSTTIPYRFQAKEYKK